MKKKLLSLITLLLLPIVMMAEEITVSGIKYDLNKDGDGTATVIANDYSGDVVIPESFNYNGKEYSVTSIGIRAFYGCKSLSSISIPSSVSRIKESAFSECTGLTAVHISDLKAWCQIDFEYHQYYPSCNPLHYAHHLYLNGEEIKDLIIPSGVTEIRDGAFQGCNALTSVTIPTSVISIRDTFEDCPNLTAIHISDLTAWCEIKFNGNPLKIAHHLYLDGEEIKDLVIPDDVTSLKYEVFSGCTGLTSVIIPNSVTEIGSDAFEDCTNLSSVTIGNSVTAIESSAFAGCTNLAAVTIPNSVISIDYCAFWGCSSLTSVTIGNSVTSIGDYAFHGCSSLTSVNIPNTVTNMGKHVFSDCSSLTSVNFADGVTSIGYGAFTRCSSLTSVTIPNSVTTIGSLAFYKCSSLTSVTIPNSVTEIAGQAFADCTSLSLVTIGNGVTSIGGNAFSGCSALQKVIIPDIATWLGIPFSNSGSNPLFFAHHLYSDENTEITNLVIPDGITTINDYAFSHCYGLTSVTIPNSVTNIGIDAFSACSNLTNVDLPYSTTNIAQGAFRDTPWEELVLQGKEGVVYVGKMAYTYIGEMPEGTSITLRDGTLSIASYAFKGCSNMVSITIPNTVETIGDLAFSGCSGLTSVTIPKSVKSIGYDAFVRCTNLKKVIVPDIAAWCAITFHAKPTLSSTTYHYTNPLLYAGHLYSDENTEIKNLIIPDGVTSIGNAAFYYCKGLTSVTIPNSVTSIGDEAFYNCSGLTSVTIGNSVSSIGSSAFYGCGGLTTVTIPNSVTEIGSGAFADCSGMTSMTIGNGVRIIGVRAFRGCKGLKKVIVPDIAAWCKISFYGYGSYGTNPLQSAGHLYSDENTEITNLIIPDGVSSIGVWAFLGCTGLTSVSIPNSVSTIGEGAFSGCTGLTSVSIPNSVTTIGGSAFSSCTGLAAVSIPNSVTSIGDCAFYQCSDLTSVTIGNSVTSIGDRSFENCSGLSSITIPNSVISIGYEAFKNCMGLTFATIGNSVTTISKGAFEGCSNLVTVTIPNSVTTIGEGAFEGCTNLATVTIPCNITSIGRYAFKGCSVLHKIIVNDIASWCAISFGSDPFDKGVVKHLYSDENTEITNVIIPDGLTSISPYAFSYTGLTSVTIPNSFKWFNGFIFWGCSGLTEIHWIPNSSFSLGFSHEIVNDWSMDQILYLYKDGENNDMVDKIASELSGKFKEIVIKDAASAIKKVVHQNSDNDVWYTISGMRIEHPTKPGLYIRNGKKIIVE